MPAALEADEKAAAAATVVAAPLAPGHQLVNGEAEIPLQDASAVLKAWRDKHGFILPDSQLLIPNQQWKLWREFNSSPKALSYWDARNLQPRSMVNAPTGTMMTIIPGEPVESTQVIADGIDRTFELWSRCRAYLMTLSYVSITEPTYFRYQQAIHRIRRAP